MASDSADVVLGGSQHDAAIETIDALYAEYPDNVDDTHDRGRANATLLFAEVRRLLDEKGTTMQVNVSPAIGGLHLLHNQHALFVYPAGVEFYYMPPLSCSFDCVRTHQHVDALTAARLLIDGRPCPRCGGVASN